MCRVDRFSLAYVDRVPTITGWGKVRKSVILVLEFSNGNNCGRRIKIGSLANTILDFHSNFQFNCKFLLDSNDA